MKARKSVGILSPTIPGVTIPRTWHCFGKSFSRANAAPIVVLFLAAVIQKRIIQAIRLRSNLMKKIKANIK